MMEASNLASPFEEQDKLSRNQKSLLAVVGIGSMLEFWDAYLIGFVMAFLAQPWGLTYGIMAVVLLASGVGAVAGGVVWGWMADRFGRKPVLVVSLLVLAASSLLLAFTPDGAWVYMAVLRVVIGLCTAGFMAQVALAQEFMPPKRRGALTGIISAITTGGLLLGAFSGAFLMPGIGWRWTFAFGAAPALIALLAARIVPESARWLMAVGRETEARRSVAWALGTATYDGPLDAPARSEPRGWRHIFGYPKILITTTLVNLGLMTGYYGITTWAPTLLAQVQAIGPAQASQIMIGFSVLGIASRLASARLADHIGRRRVGGFFALGAAGGLVLAGLIGNGLLLPASAFWLALMLAFVLADGSLAVCALYSAELWPSHVRGGGAGFAGLTGSIGKILGPVGLAVAVGSGNIVKPRATISAMLPAFGLLALFLLVCALSYLSFGIEASGRSLERIDRDHIRAPRTGSSVATTPGAAR